MKMKILFCLLAVAIANIDARLFEGQCRHIPVPVVSPFNLCDFLGGWYEVRYYIGIGIKNISVFNLIFLKD